MEKKRWVLILMALCLALVFSVSSVEAQQHHLCFAGSFCDQDSDTFFKNHRRCVHCLDLEGAELDCDDHDGDVNPGEENCDAPVASTVQICHFKNTLKHCEHPTIEGLFLGGAVQTISIDQEDRHRVHGDCIGVDSFIVDPTIANNDGIDCLNHCIADNNLQPTCNP